MLPVIAAIATGTVIRVAGAIITGAIIGKKISDHQHKKELEEIKEEVEALKSMVRKKV